MNSLVVLNLGEGSCQRGLANVTARLSHGEGQDTETMQYVGSLPSAPEISQSYHQWRQLYKALHQSLLMRLPGPASIEFDDNSITNVSWEDFRHLSEQLQKQINQWLNCDGFRTIDQRLRTQLDPKENIRFIIETEDPILQKLPWHLWCFFEHYAKAEIALSPQQYQQVSPSVPSQRLHQPMRILVVLGHSEGIDVQQDRIMLEDSAADTLVLSEPSRAELDQHLRDELGWDILFFAGHSTSEALDAMGETREKLYLNRHEQLSIAQLRYAFREAIDNGLKLAIFNSCDGLGLARELAELNLPQLIAMREPILDQVAHRFLKHFLQAFARGESFYYAVRYARERLQGLESDFPGASWLPVIYQNPTEGVFTWRAVSPSVPHHQVLPPQPSARRPVKAVNLRRLILSTSLVITLAVTGLRATGLLQPVELSAYDRLVRARPITWEQPSIDPRLLVVEITEEDTDQYGYPISDERLATVLAKLRQHQPATIGIDLHRYQANGAGRDQLLEQFNTFPDLITVCSFGWGDREIMGHPSEFSPEQANSQVGFSDLETDDLFQPGRSVVRRQLLSYDANLGQPSSSECKTPYSLSLNLALRFLQSQGVEPLGGTADSNWQLGPVVFQRMGAQTGGYQTLDGQSNQLLLHYRFNPRPAHRASLTDVLEDKVTADKIRDRVVLLGVIDPLGNDYRDTPFGELPGVWIHAHNVSQILSAVLDQRSLMWVLPQWGRLQWGDMLWIWAWAVVGGLLVWRIQSWLFLAGAGLVAIWGMRQICLMILVLGGWVPWIPALLALVGTAGVLLARKYGFLRLDALFKLGSLHRYR